MTTPSNPQPTIVIKGERAGFGIRFLAALIDGIILMLLSRIFGNVGTFFAVLYTIIFWVGQSATPGKMICNLKIVRTDGEKLTITDALIRYICYWVSAIPLFAGFVWIILDDQKQGWHDKLAGTYVIKTK
jgi:uncharacterized RDD family membrane protein YckC